MQVLRLFAERALPQLLQFAAWLALSVIIFVTVSPIELRPHDIVQVSYDRALAFTTLSALFVFAYPKHWLSVGVALTVAAGGFEFLQELSPSRHARPSDALVKAGGAVLGVVLARSLNVWRERRNQAIERC